MEVNNDLTSLPVGFGGLLLVQIGLICCLLLMLNALCDARNQMQSLFQGMALFKKNVAYLKHSLFGYVYMQTNDTSSLCLLIMIYNIFTSKNECVNTSFVYVQQIYIN